MKEKKGGITCYNHCEACEWETSKSEGISPKHTCGKERPMTEGEREIAKGLDDYFDKETSEVPSWEIEFEKQIICHCDETCEDSLDGSKHTISNPKTIKNFIRQTIKAERRKAIETYPNPSYSQAEVDRQKKQAVEEERIKLKQNIGLLRQWLNEDKIDNASKMVSSEQLEKWLI